MSYCVASVWKRTGSWVDSIDYRHFDHLMPILFIVLKFISFPFSPTGLVPEVPLLQGFENKMGCAWTLLIITILTNIFFDRSLSLLSCSRLQLYNSEALPFTYFDHPMPILFCIVFFSFCFSPTGLVPEVPLLQAFENELGRGWTRLIIAILTIVCLCFSLLELSLPLHRMVSNHFPPSFLVTTF